MSETSVESFTQPKLITFAAGFLLKLIDDEVYLSCDAVLRGKMKFLSIVLNLVSKFDEFSNIHEDFNNFLNNIETGITEWDNEELLNQFEQVISEKLQSAEYINKSGTVKQECLGDTVKLENIDENGVYSEMEIFDDSCPLIKSEHDDFEENKITSDVKVYEDPINISMLQGENDHHFATDTDAPVSSFSNLDSNTVNDTSSGNVSQEKIQDYETFKTELNRQCEKLMKPIYDSSFRKMWKCTECPYGNKHRYKVREHVEIHMSRFSHQCPFCEKICKTRNALRSHAIREHNFKINTQYGVRHARDSKIYKMHP